MIVGLCVDRTTGWSLSDLSCFGSRSDFSNFLDRHQEVFLCCMRSRLLTSLRFFSLVQESDMKINNPGKYFFFLQDDRHDDVRLRMLREMHEHR